MPLKQLHIIKSVKKCKESVNKVTEVKVNTLTLKFGKVTNPLAGKSLLKYNIKCSYLIHIRIYNIYNLIELTKLYSKISSITFNDTLIGVNDKEN